MKLTENIYLLETSRGSHVYLVRGEETVLIDTGLIYMQKGILRELEILCGDLTEIKHILLTHHDLDHIGNAAVLQQLTQADVWASREDIPYITGDKDRSSFKKYFKYIFNVPKPKNLRPYIPGKDISGVKILPTPGHTPGHVSLIYGEYLFAGDLVKSSKGKLEPYPKAWNWDHTVLLKSLQIAAAQPAAWICPAHGKPVPKHQMEMMLK